MVFQLSHQPSDVSLDTSGSFIEVILSLIPISDNILQEVDALEMHNTVRKIAHFISYMIGGMLIFGLFCTCGLFKKRIALFSWLIGVVYAITDEIHQMFVPGRGAEISDVLIDSAGVAIGVLLMFLIVSIVRKIIRRIRKVKSRIFLASPHMSEKGYEQKYVKEAFDTNWVAPLGENVNKFEEEISNYVGAKAAAAMTSGTAAIHIGLKALGVKKNDIVFCSSLTFSATVNPVIYENAIPVFIDSEPDSWNMSPVALRKAFEKYTPKAVVVVHLYGQSANMDEIMKICAEYNTPILEDAAESLGATYKGKQTGTFGKFGVFSFNGNKIITTSGGGMLVSDDEEKIQKAKFWITQSRDKARHYQHSELGYNYRMSNVVAGIGRGQLKVLEERIAKKKKIYYSYKKAFANIPYISMQPICDHGEPNYWLSTLTIDEESPVKALDIMVALENDNIESRPIWKPMHLQPIFAKYDFFNHNNSGKSVSEDIFDRGLCLPSDTKMTKDDINRVIKIVKGLF